MKNLTNHSSKPDLKVEGKMTAKDAGRVAIILAWGKSIALVIGSLAALVTAMTVLIWRLM